MKYFLLICWLFCYVSLTAQSTSHPESIETPAMVDALIDKGFEVEFNYPDSAKEIYKQAFEIAKKLHYHEGQFRYSRYITAVLNEQGNFDESLKINQWSVQLARDRKDSLNLGKSLFNLANVYNFKGEYFTAIEFYLESEAILSALNQNNYKKILYANLAVLFEEISEYETALQYLKMSSEISTVEKDTLSMLNAMINIVTVFNSMSEYDSSVLVANDIFKLLQHYESRKHRIALLINYGNSIRQLKQPQKALPIFKEAKTLSEDAGNLPSVATAYHGIAYSYYDMGNIDSAEYYIDMAMNNPLEEETVTGLLNRYLLQSDIKAQKKNYKAAYDALMLYAQLKETAVNESVRSKINELERKFKLKEMQQEIEYNQQMVRLNELSIRNKNTWLIILITGISLLLILLFLSVQLYKKKQNYHRKQLETLEKEKELSELQAAVIATDNERSRIAAEIHDDLGSGLTSVFFLTEKEKKESGNSENLDKISSATSLLMTKVNEIVWSMNDSYDSLAELVAFIRHKMAGFCEDVALDLHTNIADDFPEVYVSGETRRNIYLVIKEAFNNIAKHANASKVYFSVDYNGAFICTIKDDGKGFDATGSKWGSGLKNMKNRVESMKGSISFNQSNGTSVEISIPLN